MHSNSKQNQKFWLGSIIALISAIAFAFNMVLADLSYFYGANIHALNLSRASGFLICLIIIIQFKSVKITLPPKARWASIFVGCLLCAEMYTLLGAIKTIPVALAVLIFYTYPMLIAVYRWIKKVDRFSILSLGLLVMAFIGLIIVLINSPVTLDNLGISFAVGAAFVMAIMLIASEQSLNNHDNHVVLLHALTVVTTIIIILSITITDINWPNGQIGWLVFAGSSVFYVVATFCLFKAVSLVGPLKTAIIDNTSPVWAIIFGFVLLNETLSVQQIFGAILVICAVISLQLVSQEKTAVEAPN